MPEDKLKRRLDFTERVDEWRPLNYFASQKKVNGDRRHVALSKIVYAQNGEKNE